MSSESQERKRWSSEVVLVVIGIALATGVATAKKRGPKPSYPVIEQRILGSEIRIRVLPAKVGYEMTRTRRNLPERVSSEPELSDWVRQIASDTLRGNGFTLWVADDNQSVVTQVTRLADRLVGTRSRGGVSLDLLRQLGGDSSETAVLVQHLKVEIGPERSWDPRTGRLQVEMMTSTLRGALIRCSSGEVLWRGEMFIRDVPWIEDSNFRAAIVGMYGGLSLKGGSSDE